MTGPVTLAMLAADGKKLWLYCNDCNHNIEVEPLSLGLPPETPVPTIGRRHMKCSTCGSKEITSWPELYKGKSATDPSSPVCRRPGHIAPHVSLNSGSVDISPTMHGKVRPVEHENRVAPPLARTRTLVCR